VKRRPLPFATLNRWSGHLDAMSALRRVRNIGEVRAARAVSEADTFRAACDAQRDTALAALRAAAVEHAQAAQQTEQALRRGVSGGWQVLAHNARLNQIADMERAKDAALVQARVVADEAQQALHVSRQHWWRERRRSEMLDDLQIQVQVADQTRREWVVEEDQQ
jgi:hypothetical protein